jgi:hypothetical protein
MDRHGSQQIQELVKIKPALHNKDMKNKKDPNSEALISILDEVAREIYLELGPEDLSSSLEATLRFDDLQRITRFENLRVNNLPKMPSFELTEKINIVLQGILKLPPKFKLKECRFDIKPGGSIRLFPTYLTN